MDLSVLCPFQSPALVLRVSGLLMLGDPTPGADPGPLPNGLSRYTVECPSECTQLWSSGITVFGHFQHMRRSFGAWARASLE